MSFIELAKQRSICHPNNIDTLVRIVNELKSVSGDIVECGSYKCGTTIALTADPLKKVYAFDMFGGLPYGEGAGWEHLGDGNFEEIQSVTVQFPNIVLVRGRHEETIPKFPNQPVSLIFMDSDFYASHKVCLEHLWPMLSSGGMVVFHDWAFECVQQATFEVLGAIGVQQFPDSKNMWFIVKA